MILEMIIISILGTILHYTYNLSNKNKIVGLFSAVNESTWEHIKIGLTATFIASLVDGYLYGDNLNYFFAKFLSLLVIIFMIPIFFYGFKFLFKKNIPFVNIMTFYVTIILSVLTFYKVLSLKLLNYIYKYIGIVGIFIVFGTYMTLTLLPIKNELFKDPVTGKYGFRKKINMV